MDKWSADTCPRQKYSEYGLECYLRSLLKTRDIDPDGLQQSGWVEEEWCQWAIDLLDRVIRKDLFWVITECIDVWCVVLDLSPEEVATITTLNSRNFRRSSAEV